MWSIVNHYLVCSRARITQLPSWMMIGFALFFFYQVSQMFHGMSDSIGAYSSAWLTVSTVALIYRSVLPWLHSDDRFLQRVLTHRVYRKIKKIKVLLGLIFYIGLLLISIPVEHLLIQHSPTVLIPISFYFPWSLDKRLSRLYSVPLIPSSNKDEIFTFIGLGIKYWIRTPIHTFFFLISYVSVTAYSALSLYNGNNILALIITMMFCLGYTGNSLGRIWGENYDLFNSQLRLKYGFSQGMQTLLLYLSVYIPLIVLSLLDLLSFDYAAFGIAMILGSLIISYLSLMTCHWRNVLEFRIIMIVSLLFFPIIPVLCFRAAKPRWGKHD
ncbi:MAG: hypothetical protein HRU19_31935 [Pseudobacteriovorax sp.]|nr:hypothetical protein [Pseudobacteriovorax sp.]